MRVRGRRPRTDDGFTLLETVVGMTLMAIFMSIVTGSIVMMFSSSNHSQAVAETTQQVNTAFLRLERLTRYANFISAPGADGNDGNWYAEFRTVDPDTQEALCYQVRVDHLSGQLQLRDWPSPTTPGDGSPSATGWQLLASGVTNGSAGADSPNRPFALVTKSIAPDDDSLAAARLTLTLVVSGGHGSAAATSTAQGTFVGLNTSTAGQQDTSTCGGMRP